MFLGTNLLYRIPGVHDQGFKSSKTQQLALMSESFRKRKGIISRVRFYDIQEASRNSYSLSLF
jgi:hypothetical protein